MNKNVIIAGGAIFAMFFGSGNIVFPLILTQKLGSEWPMALLGFCLSGVIVPLVGLISIALLGGDNESFFKWLTKPVSFMLQLWLLCLFGPFGVTPRCMTVAFGGFKILTPNIPASVFYAVFCVVLWFLTLNKDKVMPIIGKFLTPIKLSLLTLVVVIGIYNAPTTTDKLVFSAESFYNGIFNGYQTMDLIGAIYFATIAMSYFKKEGDTDNRKLLIHGLQASLISGILLGAMYLGFFWLGGLYHSRTMGLSGPDILPKIAGFALGDLSNMIVGCTIIITCLTTATALISVFTDFITKYVSCWGISYKAVLFISLATAYFVAAVIGFEGIYSFLGSALHIVYPLMIALALFNIGFCLIKQKPERNKNIKKAYT